LRPSQSRARPTGRSAAGSQIPRGASFGRCLHARSPYLVGAFGRFRAQLWEIRENAAQLSPLDLTDATRSTSKTIGSSYALRNGLARNSWRSFSRPGKPRSRRFGSSCAHVRAQRRSRGTALVRFRNHSVNCQHANDRIDPIRSPPQEVPTRLGPVLDATTMHGAAFSGPRSYPSARCA
jgi:hypothetical protein